MKSPEPAAPAHSGLKPQNLLTQIRLDLHSLSKSETKVAQVILDDPERCTRISIAALAAAADVSEPSVNRFCKRFACRGFPDLKINLAQSLTPGLRYVSNTVSADDDAATFTQKVFDGTINNLVLARDQIDHNQVALVVDKLIQAKQIFFFGLGASASVAKDAAHKFFRFNLPVSAHEDVLMQRMQAAAGGMGDVFFVISFTGRTRELVETANIARQNDATVIGLTSPDSPLAEACHLTLATSIPENTDEYMPMASRIVHLVILDALATGVMLKRGEDFVPHLEKIKESLAATRFSRRD